MKIEIDLTDVSLAYLKKLAKKHNTTESDVIEGLLIGYSLRRLLKLNSKKKKKKIKEVSYGGETFNLPTKDKS